MLASWTVIEQPQFEPVSLSQAKAWLRVDGNDEDAVIAGLITAAREMVESDTQLALVERRIRLLHPPPTTREIELPLYPVTTVHSVTYYDVDNTLQIFSSSNYYLGGERLPQVRLVSTASWPAMTERDDALRIEFTAGNNDSSTWSPVALQAIQLLIGHWFANREAVVAGTISREVELSYKALVQRAAWRGM